MCTETSAPSQKGCLPFSVEGSFGTDVLETRGRSTGLSKIKDKAARNHIAAWRAHWSSLVGARYGAGRSPKGTTQHLCPTLLLPESKAWGFGPPKQLPVTVKRKLKVSLLNFKVLVSYQARAFFFRNPRLENDFPPPQIEKVLHSQK